VTGTDTVSGTRNVVELRWGRDDRPGGAHGYLLDDGGRCVLDVSIGRYERDGFIAAAYGYDGPRVVRLAEYFADFTPPVATQWYVVTWAAAGRVERIMNEHHPDSPPLYNDRRARGPVLAEAQRLLVERIPLLLKVFTPVDRVYGLALGYNDSNRWELMPPAVGLRVASERSAYLARPDHDPDREDLWNPSVTDGPPLSEEFPVLEFDEELMALGTEVAMLVDDEAGLDAVVQCHIRVARAQPVGLERDPARHRRLHRLPGRLRGGPVSRPDRGVGTRRTRTATA
jgi:hypothetical protein